MLGLILDASSISNQIDTAGGNSYPHMALSNLVVLYTLKYTEMARLVLQVTE